MKHECDIVRDLMPMCVDGTASEKTRQMVEEHVAECPPCETVYAEMRRDEQIVMPVQESAPEFVTTVKRMKNRRKRRTWLTLLLGVLIAMTVVCAGFGTYYWYFLDEVLLDAAAQLTLVTSTDGIALIHASAAPRDTRLVLKLSEMIYPEEAQGQYEVYAYLYTTRCAMRGERDDTYFVIGDMENDQVSMEHGYQKCVVYRMLCGRVDGSGQVFYLSTEDDVQPVSLKGVHLKSPERAYEASVHYGFTDYGYVPTSTPIPTSAQLNRSDGYTLITATPMPAADGNPTVTPTVTTSPAPTFWRTDPTPPVER